MKQNAMWKKWIGCITMVMVLALACTGGVLATEAAPAAEVPTVLGDDLLSVDEEATGSETADEANVSGKPVLGIKVANMNTSSYAVVKGILPMGAYVTNVEEDSLAAEAGLLAGDIVVEVDETAVTNIAKLTEILQEKEAGESVILKIFRVEGIESAQVYSDIGEGEYIDVSIELTLPKEA